MPMTYPLEAGFFVLYAEEERGKENRKYTPKKAGFERFTY